MSTLSEDNSAAKAMGLSYGKYMAMLYEKGLEMSHSTEKDGRGKRKKRRFTDDEAFALWKDGKNDFEIGASLGVSRQMIQKWRDTMELPSTAKYDIDTDKYRMVKTPAGAFIIHGDDI